jgi:ABC-type uncharacterized transport system substrate-binding protein
LLSTTRSKRRNAGIDLNAIKMVGAVAVAVLSWAGHIERAEAHPHIFVDARLEIDTTDDGRISEIRHVWRFDEVFSSSVLLDFDTNRNLKLDGDELKKVGETVRTSLKDFNYYTVMTDAGKDMPVAPPDVINVDYQDGQLLMFFAVKPGMPMPLKGKLTFGVYDPTFYTSIDFPNDGDLVVTGADAAMCKAAVVRPDPDTVLKDNEKNLTDAFFNDPTGNDVSKMFATRLELTC